MGWELSEDAGLWLGGITNLSFFFSSSFIPYLFLFSMRYVCLVHEIMISYLPVSVLKIVR